MEIGVAHTSIAVVDATNHTLPAVDLDHSDPRLFLPVEQRNLINSLQQSNFIEVYKSIRSPFLQGFANPEKDKPEKEKTATAQAPKKKSLWFSRTIPGTPAGMPAPPPQLSDTIRAAAPHTREKYHKCLHDTGRNSVFGFRTLTDIAESKTFKMLEKLRTERKPFSDVKDAYDAFMAEHKSNPWSRHFWKGDIEMHVAQEPRLLLGVVDIILESVADEVQVFTHRLERCFTTSLGIVPEIRDVEKVTSEFDTQHKILVAALPDTNNKELIRNVLRRTEPSQVQRAACILDLIESSDTAISAYVALLRNATEDLEVDWNNPAIETHRDAVLQSIYSKLGSQVEKSTDVGKASQDLLITVQNCEKILSYALPLGAKATELLQSELIQKVRLTPTLAMKHFSVLKEALGYLGAENAAATLIQLIKGDLETILFDQPFATRDRLFEVQITFTAAGVGSLAPDYKSLTTQAILTKHYQSIVALCLPSSLKQVPTDYAESCSTIAQECLHWALINEDKDLALLAGLITLLPGVVQDEVTSNKRYLREIRDGGYDYCYVWKPRMVSERQTLLKKLTEGVKGIKFDMPIKVDVNSLDPANEPFNYRVLDIYDLQKTVSKNGKIDGLLVSELIEKANKKISGFRLADITLNLQKRSRELYQTQRQRYSDDDHKSYGRSYSAPTYLSRLDNAEVETVLELTKHGLGESVSGSKTLTSSLHQSQPDPFVMDISAEQRTLLTQMALDELPTRPLVFNQMNTYFNLEIAGDSPARMRLFRDTFENLCEQNRHQEADLFFNIYCSNPVEQQDAVEPAEEILPSAVASPAEIEVPVKAETPSIQAEALQAVATVENNGPPRVLRRERIMEAAS